MRYVRSRPDDRPEADREHRAELHAAMPAPLPAAPAGARRVSPRRRRAVD